MVHTKITERHGYHVLQVKDKSTGKYKQVFKSKKVSEVNHKKVELQKNSIKAQAALSQKTIVDTYKDFALDKIAMAEHPQSGMRLKSVNHYFSFWKNWINQYFPKDLLLNEITVPVMDQFFLDIKKAGCTHKQANLIVKSFLTFLKWCIEKQFITEIGVMLVYKVKNRPALKDNITANMLPKKTVMINRQEVARLFKHLMPTNKNPNSWLKFAVVVTLAFTGLRLGELRALRWDRIDWILGKITINQAIVEGVMKDQVKADGSFDSVRMHSALFRVLSIWKSIQSKYYTPRKMPLVFASLKFVHETVPLADKTINDWLKIAYQDLGFAKIEVVNNSSGSKSHTRTVVNKFHGCVSKTFRHFAATSLTDAQAGNEILTDNFIKGQIRHKDIRLTKGLYGDHTGLDPSGERAAAEQEALDGAFPNLIDMEALNEN